MAARRVADRLLLASCDVSDSAAAVRDGRLLLHHALQFVAAGPDGVLAAARACLEDLREWLSVDQAIVAIVDLTSGGGRVVLAIGAGPGLELLEGAAPGLADRVRDALGSRGFLELPSMEDGAGSSDPALAGVPGSMRWSLRAIDDARALVVALHSEQPGRYWAPASRRLHDGFAEILAAASTKLAAEEEGPRSAGSRSGR